MDGRPELGQGATPRGVSRVHRQAGAKRLTPDRRAQSGGQRRQGLPRPAIGHGVTGDDDRARGARQQAGGCVEFLVATGSEVDRPAGQGWQRPARRRLDIERNAHHCGAGWRPVCGHHRARQHVTKIVDVADLLREARDGSRHTDDIPAQERRARQQLLHLLPHDHQHRHACPCGVEHAREGVGQSRLHVHEHSGHAARRLRVAIGHPHDHRLGEPQHESWSPRCGQRLDDGQLGGARVAEDDLDALL